MMMVVVGEGIVSEERDTVCCQETVWGEMNGDDIVIMTKKKDIHQ